MEQVVVGSPGSKDHVHSTVPLSPETNLSKESPEERERAATARLYSRKKMWLGIAGTVIFFILTVIFVATGLSRELDQSIRRVVSNDYRALIAFVAIIGVAETILTFPLSYYSGFYLEHRYHLSNQSFLAWIREGSKSLLVSIPLGLPILLMFFYSLKTVGSLWWLPVGTLLFLITVVLARLAPVLILPLFYKFVPIENGSMKEKILTLCNRAGVRVEGIFTFDLSKNTKKANAAFTGIGKSKRIILGDTLVQNFTDDEVETVFAHELGHYKKKHIWMMMIVGTLISFLGLFLTAQLYGLSLPWFGFTAPDEIGALPLLTLWLGFYSLVTSPISNYLSRINEFSADRYAVEITSNSDAFVNALSKLAKINLAETSPPAIVEFLFHSHPSIEKRIRAIRSLAHT
jgi:STE24 endopeptidase